jgi:hypothetical protein
MLFQSGLSSAPPPPKKKKKKNKSPKNDKTAVDGLLVSPFTVNQDRLLATLSPRYVHPENGQVNGHAKFNWPSRAQSRRPSGHGSPSSEDDAEDITPNITRSYTFYPNPTIIPLVETVPAKPPAPDASFTYDPEERMGK